MNRPKNDEGVFVGCLIIIFGGCAFIGGFLFFFVLLIRLFCQLTGLPF